MYCVNTDGVYKESKITFIHSIFLSIIIIKVSVLRLESGKYSFEKVEHDTNVCYKYLKTMPAR